MGSAVAMMDRDLGSNEIGNDGETVRSLDAGQMLFCFVERTGKKIVGCVTCEARTFAHKIKVGREEDNVEREEAKERCYVGIVKMWVHFEYRRQHITSLLIDCVRRKFLYGTEIEKTLVGFCQPTRLGQLFAAKYCGTEQILVY